MQPTKTRSGGRTLLRFLLFGPPIGGVTLLLGMMFDSVVQYGGSFGWGALVAVPAVAFLAYPFGILPAFLTGMAAMGLSTVIRDHRMWLVVVTAVGVASGALYVFLSLSAAVVFGAAGGIAAFLSGIASLSVRPLPANATPARS